MRLSAKSLIELKRRAAVLSEGEIGMTEKLLRDRSLLRRIDDLRFQTGNPLDPGFLRCREMDSTLNRHWPFHGPINLIQPVWIGHQRQNRFLHGVGLCQRINRGPHKADRDSEKDKLPFHLSYLRAKRMPDYKEAGAQTSLCPQPARDADLSRRSQRRRKPYRRRVTGHF